jgi:hypothetical protein
MPIGIPGWPEFAACTASMAKARIALASSAVSAAAAGTGTAAVARFGTVKGTVMVLGAEESKARAGAGGICGRQRCCRR